VARLPEVALGCRFRQARAERSAPGRAGAHGRRHLPVVAGTHAEEPDVRNRGLWVGILSIAAVLGGAHALGSYVSRYYLGAAEAEPRGGPEFAIHHERHAARGFGADSARVDSQITFRIPDGKAGAVYEYLKGKYVGQSGVLADRFPSLDLHGQPMSDVSLFTDQYFDTPTLTLYRTRNSARHRIRINTTNPEDRKSGRELVQLKVTPPGEFTLRNEFKYKVEAHSASQKSFDDVHPLLRLVSKPQRDDFKKVFKDARIDPYSLAHVFTIRQTRSRGYLNWGDTNIMSFSVDEGSAGVLWAQGRFASVELGLVEVAYTEADDARRQKMWEIRDAIVEDLLQQFPDLKQTTNSKYGIVLSQLIQQMPMLPLVFRLI
jgi:hypothetical protein